MTDKEDHDEGVVSDHGTFTSSRRIRLHELLCRMLDDALKPEELRELCIIVQESIEARSQYIQFVNMHAGLGYAAQSQRPGTVESLSVVESITNSGNAQATSVDSGGRVRNVARDVALRVNRWIFSHRALAASAMLVLAASCVLLVLQPVIQPSIYRERVQYSARIIDPTSCTWDPSNAALATDGLVRGSDTLRIKEGIAKLQFDSGAQVIVRGPAELFVESGMKCRLDNGELTANVPKAARGFTVQTRLGKLVDLGTSFGVRVGDEIDLHVFEGKVEVYPGQAESSSPQRGANSHGGTPVELLTTGATRRLRISDDSSTVKLVDSMDAEHPFTRMLQDGASAPEKQATLTAVDSFEQGRFGARLVGRDGGFGWSSAWTDQGVDSNSLSFSVGPKGITSRGSGDGAVHRHLAPQFANLKTLYFSGDFQIDGPDPICSAWLELFKYDTDRFSDAELDLVTIGITDGQFSGRMAPWGTKAEEKKIGDCGRYEVGSRHLIVGKLEFNAVGNQERLSVWVDPSLAAEPHPDRVILKDTGWEYADAVAIRCWEMDNATSATIDEVRVGTTWASVVQ